jgi:hypothetical protein|tara:strand:- start:2205 stop:2684 length:480 start_codon:yes stop_codon:yes gene_type:complete
MAKRTPYKKPTNAHIIKAFEFNMGLKGKVADELKVTRTTLDSWINNDPELQLAINDTNLKNVELSEENLFKRINGFTKVTKTTVTRADGKKEVTEKETYYPPSSTDIQFHLSRKGRHHGYSQTLDIEHKLVEEFSAEQLELKIAEVAKRLEIDYKPNNE